MRLIDADKLENVDFSDCIDSMEIMNVIDEQPTAYDVDVVVSELEKKIQTHTRCIEYEKKNGMITEEFQQRKAVEVLKDAIKIVETGGDVNE